MKELGTWEIGDTKRIRAILKNKNGSYQDPDSIYFSVVTWDGDLVVKNISATKESDGIYWVDLNCSNNSFSKGAYICAFEGSAAVPNGYHTFYEEAIFYLGEKRT